MSATAAEFGIVGYTHAGGVDRPLVVWKGATVVVPHTNWRGVFGKGTNSSGGTSTVAIEWPGFLSTAYHAIMTSSTPTTSWMGSLIGRHRDAGGWMYMRNRYYDPATGQFTQTDPIGLGGGMNTYGFANGDPVGKWDPFGTCAWGIGPDAAHGRCSGMEPEDDWPECQRQDSGACKKYIPRDDWERIGARIRRMPDTPGKCRWIRNRLLRLWEQGPEIAAFRFWEGRDVIRRDAEGQPLEWFVGQYNHDPVSPWFEFERRVSFESRVILSHEGLHMYYTHHPEPHLTAQQLHVRIYEEQADCRLR